MHFQGKILVLAKDTCISLFCVSEMDSLNIIVGSNN